MSEWHREMVLFSPVFSEKDVNHYRAKGYMTRDLVDYANLFGNAPQAERPN
jgi:hypothetical protein